MRTFDSLRDWQVHRRSLRGQNIGFVPTMGALHTGHASLLERARRENDVSVLSIYVNPTQFNNPEDLQKYPSTLKADLEMAERLNVDAVLLPKLDQIYPDHYRFRVTETEFSRELCGAHRPGHFDGVLTVVLKLLNLVQPDRAYFGEKDHQQLSLIRDMVQAFFLPTEIIACPTVRETDGLAMSSRNVRLSPQERKTAPILAQILKNAASPEEAKSALEGHGFRVDYVVDKNNRRYGAAHLGSVRLIDNVER